MRLPWQHFTILEKNKEIQIEGAEKIVVQCHLLIHRVKYHTLKMADHTFFENMWKKGSSPYSPLNARMHRWTCLSHVLFLNQQYLLDKHDLGSFLIYDGHVLKKSLWKACAYWFRNRVVLRDFFLEITTCFLCEDVFNTVVIQLKASLFSISPSWQYNNDKSSTGFHKGTLLCHKNDNAVSFSVVLSKAFKATVFSKVNVPSIHWKDTRLFNIEVQKDNIQCLIYSILFCSVGNFLLE